MNKLIRKMDGAIIRAKNYVMMKKEGSDQIIIMFIKIGRAHV